MVDRQHGKPRFEGPVGKRQGLGRGLDGGCGPRRPLADHFAGRFDGHDPSVARFIVARSRPHVQQGGDGTEGGEQPGGDAGVGPAQAGIADTDLVIEGGHRGWAGEVGPDGMARTYRRESRRQISSSCSRAA